jgi:predicted metal-dependent enzyme (double-stranded beta helix superfamily)
MFDTERFIEDCKSAIAGSDSQKAVREVMARAMSDPAAVLKGLGAPTKSEIRKLYASETLTIINVIWAPYMTIMPHNHEMWATIGIYTGREDNVFWRRVPDGEGGRIEAAGAKALSQKDVSPLGKDIIHSVTNPIPRLTGAIHVYGGDFFNIARSEWDAESLLEAPYDVPKNLKLFEDFGRLTDSQG